MFVGVFGQIRGIQKSSFHPIQFGSLCWSGPWESSRKKLLNPSRSIETNRYTSFLLAVYWKPSFPGLLGIIVARSINSWFLSYSYSMKWYSYSYSKRSSTALQPIRLQITANRFDQPSSTSTKKSDAMHELTFHPQ